MTNLNLRRLLVVSLLLSAGMLRSAAQLQPPSCAVSCAHSAASQTGCDTYKVECFCGSPQFMSAAGGCIQATCAGLDIQGATDFIDDLCTVSLASSAVSSSDSPFATASAQKNAAAYLKRDMALLGVGVLGAVVAAIN